MMTKNYRSRLKDVLTQFNFNSEAEPALPAFAAYALAALALSLGIFSRWLPHPDNVSPMLAASLVAGLLLGRKRVLQASLLSGLAVVISDLFVGFHSAAPFVYGGMALASLISARFTPWILSVGKMGGVRWVPTVAVSSVASLMGSAVFFIVSNVGVWLVGGLYPLTTAGLATCFQMGIPFFAKSLAGDLLFGTAMLAVSGAVIVRYRGALGLKYAG